MTLIKNLLFLFPLCTFVSCGGDDDATTDDDGNIALEYDGTGAVTQGLAETVTENLLDCGRIGGVGTIDDTEGNTWTVPAEVNYTNNAFPFASELNNPCSGANYSTTTEALSQLDGSDIIEVDADGELVIAYIFADNYFELYINGTPVGKDNVPFTEFNSDLVRFRVDRPFTAAMKLVDWEENLGIGSESNAGSAYHPGDGGVVAVFTAENGDIIGVTDASWKAQTFYTAPVKDLSCLSENGSRRLSDNCDDSGSSDGTGYYAVHWEVPADWTRSDFDDSTWPSASIYTNQEIGVDNKRAFTNFTNVFDDPARDAQFIWSTNVVLDNEVIVRATIQ